MCLLNLTVELACNYVLLENLAQSDHCSAVHLNTWYPRLAEMSPFTFLQGKCAPAAANVVWC